MRLSIRNAPHRWVRGALAYFAVLQHLAQEVLQAGVLRMLEDIRRAALLDELAVSHEQNAVADLAGEAHLVRDDDHRHALLRQLLHDLEHLADHLRVECARQRA